jgi:RNA polymerase sigma-70 factor (sigma-E family)
MTASQPSDFGVISGDTLSQRSGMTASQPSDFGVISGDTLSQRSGLTASEPSDVVARPTDVTEAWAGRLPRVSSRADSDADRAVTELYSAHYRSLVRLAALLVRDLGTAEEVVQDAFVAMHGGWHRLRDNEKALAYLRQAVVNRSRSVLRHRQVVDRNAPKPAPDMPSAEHGAIALFERSAVIAALRTLPARQREAVVLRFYADMAEAQIAETMRISRGAVKSHTARAMQALRSILERDE